MDREVEVEAEVEARGRPSQALPLGLCGLRPRATPRNLERTRFALVVAPSVTVFRDAWEPRRASSRTRRGRVCELAAAAYVRTVYMNLRLYAPDSSPGSARARALELRKHVLTYAPGELKSSAAMAQRGPGIDRRPRKNTRATSGSMIFVCQCTGIVP